MDFPRAANYVLEPEFFADTVGPAAESLLEAAQALGATRWAALARAWCVPYVYRGMEQAFASGAEPVPQINAAFRQLTAFLQAATQNNLHTLGAAAEGFTLNAADQTAIETVTGQHYGQLFQAFSAAAFWEEPVKLLRTRLERNDIQLNRLPEQSVLDAGCGGGRYTAAWRALGAQRAVGLDVSPTGIRSAQERVNAAGLTNIEFQEGSVLALPFPDASFDIVFSNGVLHHTVDWRTGIGEALRVLKPGGFGWLYLIEKPGGLFWTIIEVLRALLKNERHETARLALQMLGLPDNRVFYMLDHVMAPVNERLTPDEISTQLAAAGATQIRRLERGADFDRVEQIWRKDPYAAIKYGVGENRFVFSKEK